MASRLFLTLSLVYMPLYLDEALNQDAETLASVPFASFVASFVASLGVKYSNGFLGSKVSAQLPTVALQQQLDCRWRGEIRHQERTEAACTCRKEQLLMALSMFYPGWLLPRSISLSGGMHLGWNGHERWTGLSNVWCRGASWWVGYSV